MRFFLILTAIVAIGYFGISKAYEKFWLKDVDKRSLEITGNKPAPESKPVESKSIFSGGSLTSSINSSLDMTKAPQVLKASRIVNFQFRTLPTSDTLQGFSALGVVAVLDAGARQVFLHGPFDMVKEVGDLLEGSDIVPGGCSMRGWIVWVSDADRNGWEFTSELGINLADDFKAEISGTDVLLSAGVDEVSAAIKIMASDTKISVVQEPHVRLTDGIESRIESLEEVPIPETTLSNGIASESITYKRVGLELIVKPMFLPGNRVRLSVTQIGGLVGRTAEIKGAEIPVLQTQKVASDVELTIGQSLVLGGVRSTRTKKNKGWFSNTDELETGILYVVVALYHDAPRAVPVVAPEWGPAADALISDVDEGVLPPLED